jgi:hypothetical protein
VQDALDTKATHPETEVLRSGSPASMPVERRVRSQEEWLLKANGPAWTDGRISETFKVSVAIVAGERQRCCEEGLEIALRPKNLGCRAGESWTGARAPDRFWPAPALPAQRIRV